MDIYWGGQALAKIKGKNASVIIDPFDPDYTGLKLPKDLVANVCLITHSHSDHNNAKVVVDAGNSSVMAFDKPGEYEIAGAVVTGIASFHDEKEGAERGINTIFHIMLDGMNLVHLGDFGQSSLSEDQLALIGPVDILFVPVGGVYTIDGKRASAIVAQIEPKIIVPIHYKIEGLKFELEGVEVFLKEMGVEGAVPLPKLPVNKDKLPEEPQVVVLSKS